LREFVGLSNATNIGPTAFYNCTSLEIEELNLPNLETLGQNAFYRVKIKKISNLGNITALPTATTSNQNFGDKSVLEEVVLPNTLNKLGRMSFYNYSVLNSVLLSSNVFIDGSCFEGCVSLSDIDFTKILGFLGEYTFMGCTSLPTIVSMPLLSSEIPNQTFNGCTSIKEIHVPLATAIGMSAFNSCTKLELAEVESVTTFAAAAFNRCTALKKVVLRDVTAFNGDVFWGCTALAEVIVNNITPPTLSSNAFQVTNSTFQIYVPDASVTAYREASGWSAYADRIKPLSEYAE
jgi:hypothetical protein